MLKKNIKILATGVAIYYTLAAIPVVLYLGFVLAASVSPPSMCDSVLAEPQKEQEFQKVCRNRLLRPVMYLYPILFVQM